MSDKQTIFILRTSALESIVSDTYSVAMIAVIFGIAHWFDSDAVAAIGLIWLLLFATNRLLKTMQSARKSPQEAVDYICETYAVRPSNGEQR